MRRRWIVLALCGYAAMLASCAGSGGREFKARPGERFTVKQSPTSSGSLSDLASQVTTDTLLGYKGAKLLGAQPFAPCPGEAGEQTFTLQTGQGPAVLHVAFTQWNGKTTVASYQRPAKAPDDPQAMDALRRGVCTTAL
jgi:hypothetical protein